MIQIWKETLWRQLGASIDSLELAFRACPDDVWGDKKTFQEFWYIGFHTLFFLDFYFSEKTEGFAPPSPFGLEELDPAGVFPPRVYTKEELLTYLNFCRNKCRSAIRSLTVQNAHLDCGSVRPGLTRYELYLYNMRHVQHHTAQLNFILRQKIDSAPRWVSVSRTALDES